MQLWKFLTDLDPAKKAATVVLSLEGKPKEIALAIGIEVLQTEAGYDRLIEVLDGYYEKNKMKYCTKKSTEKLNIFFVLLEKSHEIVFLILVSLLRPFWT